MAARNPLLDAMTGGGDGNPLLNAMAASEAVTGLTGPRATPAPSLADTITNPNSLEGIRQSRAAEASRLPDQPGMGEVRRPPADAANVLRGLGITTVEAWRQAGNGIKMQAQDLLGPAIDSWIESNMPSAMTQAERRAAFGGTEAEKDFARSQARSDAATPEFQSDFWEAVYGGLQSTAQTAPGIAAGILAGPAAGLGVLGAQTEAQSYGKYRGRGATPGMAGLGAVGEGAVEVGTELLPMGFLVGKLGKAGAGEFLTGLLARELPTEQIATFAQDAIDTAVANPDKTWEQFWAERPDAAYKTAIATVVQSGIYGGVNAIAARKPAPMAISTPGEIDQAARDAFRPEQDGKVDVPLTPGDRASPIPDAVIQKGKNALADALGADRATKPATPAAAARQVAPAADQFSRMVQITLGSESGNRDLDANGNILTSPAGAKGRMQVLDGTNLDPGFGVRPAQDNSLAERARVGRDYLAAMLKRYGGDPAKAWGAYNWGPGHVDDAIAERGGDWLSAAPAETRSYVFKNLSKLGREGFTESGEVNTIQPTPQVDDEDPIAFAARILGEDFLSNDQSPAVPDPAVAPEAEAAPFSPEPPATPAPAPEVQAQPAPVAEAPAPVNAQADIRGEAINNEWSRFSPDSGTLNLPRADMPQIDAAHRGAFANFLKGRGISSHTIDIPAANLRPTQAEYSEARVQSAKDREGGNRAILASNDGYIVDGHHQWMAARDNGENIRTIMLDAPIAEVLRAGHDFPSSTIDEGQQQAAQNINSRRRADRRNDIETDLLTFLAANGGISDEEGGHSLRAQRNLQRFIPGLGSLIRPGGMSIDYARERMVEAGWLPDGATEADALAMIEDASFRPVYHPASERGERAAVGADQEEARQQNARELVQQEAERLGIETLTPADIDFAASLSLNEGYSERDALWAALEQAMAADFAAYPDTVKEQYNVPFDAEGAAGWSRVEEPFAEPESGSADQEGGERSAPVERAASEGESAPVGPGEAEGGVTVEDTPSGKGVVVRGASEAQLDAIKAALPEKASGMVGRDGGVTYSKKHEDAIRSALRTAPDRETQDAPASAAQQPEQSTPPASPPEGRTADAAQALPSASAPTKPKKAGDNRHVWNGQRWRVEKDFDYLKAGQVYEIESARKNSAYFKNVETGGGTSIQTYQIGRALDNGWLKMDQRSDGVTENVTPEAPQGRGRQLSDDSSKAAWRARGAQAFSDGAERLPPKQAVAGDSGAWMDGWDEAYRAAEADTQLATEAPQPTNNTLSGNAENEANGYTARDVGAMSEGLRATVERTDSRPEAQRTILDAIGRGLIPDGDMLTLGNPRWALERGYADIGYTERGRGGRLTDAGRARLAELNAETEPAPAPQAPRQFEANRIFTADRVEAARERLRQKLSGTTFNSGIDPEVLMDGMIVSGAYIESGVRRFADVARALSTDLGMSLQQLRPYLAAFYNGARDLLEGQGEDISDMDGPGAVRAALTMIEEQARGTTEPAGTGVIAEESPQPSQGEPTAQPAGRVDDAFVNAFLAGRAFASITEARAFAQEQTGQSYAPGTEAAKQLDEAIESAVVYAARAIAIENEGDPQRTYGRLVQLYGQQPRLGVRTSTSVEQQAYSTPVPLSYLASRLAGIGQETTVYEPTAGNGSLLIDARPTYVTANELNPDRVAQLREFLRGAKISQNDAAEWRPAGQFDVVTANPPFGSVKDDAGNTVRFQVDSQYSTNEIDHAIAMKALEAMKDNGRAVLIVGGINKQITDPRARADAYNGKAKREFYFKLYSQYNVVDHFTVDGALYAKQGAGWPVDVIVIDGRGKSSLRLPAVSAPRQYNSWDALQEVLTNGRNANPATASAVRGSNGSAATQGARPVATDVGNLGSERSSRDNGRAGRDQAQQPRAVRAGSGDGQSGGIRVDAERAPVDQAPGAVFSEPALGRDPVTPTAAQQPIPEVAENERQVAYQAGSRSGAMGTLVPVNMQTAISDALDALAQRRGNIDTYVSRSLGYTQAEMNANFGAEQVDAIALAIDNIERGAGFIIGDQTGIGKGRVNAAVIRYAIRQGLNPVFVTEKPNLYADMFRDMEDIGLPKMLGRPINAVMTNSGVTVPLGEGRDPLRSPADAKKHDQALRDISLKGLKAAGVDVLMTTYSQMQTVRGKATERQEVIRRLANGGLVILDESHNAGGTQNAFKEAGAPPNRAEFVRELVQAAQGTFYSSATYAKRPDVMDLYSATDMKLAVDDLEKLGEAIAKGGVPMQQVVAAMLARAGQYVRRERSFDGISYNTPTIEVDRGQYNNVSTVLAAIQDFSENIVGPAVEMVDMELRESGENIAPDGSTGSAGAASTNFTAIMHNVVDQMLLAFGANEAANRAIDAIRAGEKPVIALASTLETFIDEYAADAGAQPGDKLDITFADIFRRYLERTRRYTVKKAFAEKGDKPIRKRLTDEQLGPAGVRAFNDALALIDQAELESLPGSPIDFIISRIEDAGFKVGEITGRSMGIEYRQDGTYLKKRGQDQRSIKGRLTAINGFNGGSIDAMILNKSGSTGLSLHASDRFKDQRKRRMIIVQADGNIDTHMQMLGRVHRTGQVVLPEYDQLVVGVPAARRPAAVLAKKMASLNANTTASRDSALTSSDVLDFMNVYGDEIAARLMEDEPDIHMRLGQPLSETDKGGLNREEAARKVTGRIPLLPIDTQEDLYQRLEDEYRALIAQKDAAGENALEAKTFDFDAELVDRTEAQPPVVGSSSPFADGVYVERVRVKRTGKPIPGRDVIGMIADGLEVDAPAGAPAQALAQLQREGAAINKARADQTIADARAYIPEATASIKDEEKQKAERDKLSQTLREFEAIRRSIAPGDTVRIKTDNGNVYGVITDIYRSGRAKNPAALGVWRTRIAIVDAAREMTISFSQMKVPGGEAKEGRIALEKADSIGLFRIIDAFDEMQVDSREERSIVTGNLLAGFDYVNGKGAIINYTASGGQVRQGILLPREFNLEKHQAAKPIALSTPEMVDAFLRAEKGGGNLIGNGKTGSVAVSAIPHRDTFIITAAKAKSTGGEFFLNPALREVMGDFVSRSNGMVADSSMAKAVPAIRALMESGVRFEVPAGAADDTKAIARDIVDRMRPPAPEPVAQPQETLQTVATDNFADVDQPQRTMTQQQRGELEARQQQSMARRGGQEAISDQAGGLFSSERDQDSLFSIEASEQNQRDWGDVVPRLNEAFRKMGLVDKVTLEAVDLILNDPNIAGRYTPRTRILQVALSTAQNPEYTLDHEAIHALYDLGLFNTSEWNALRSAATKDAKLMASVRERYGRLSEDRIIEEAIADMFAQWRAGRRSQSGFARKALQRILDFLTAIRRTVTGARAEDEIRDILRRIENGEVGGRDPDGPGGGGGTRYSRIGEAASALMQSGQVDKIREGLDTWRTRLQDRFLPLLRTQQQIEMQSGRAIPEGQDAYLAEELMTGKVGARLERLADELVSPMLDSIQADGLTPDEVETYLYARHAAERNARISSINSEFAEGEGSGMTDAEAASILARAEAEGKTEALDRVAEKVDAILNFALDTRVEAGLLSEEEAEAWRDTYEHYVPLRGQGEVEPEVGADRPQFGSGINVRGKESKRAFGRRSRARDILAYSIMQAEEAIARAGRNEVAQAFYNLAQANPNPDFWTTNRVTRKPVWNEASGTVTYRNDGAIQPEDEPYTVSLKVGGQERRVTLNRENPAAVRLAAAMRRLNEPGLTGPLRVMSSFNRFLSRVNTGWNPEFIITNALRDIQTAAINLSAEEADGIVSGTLLDYKAAMGATMRGNGVSLRGNVDRNFEGEWGKWYREFLDNGGRVYFNQIENVADIAKRIEKQVSGKATGSAAQAMKAKAVVKSAFDFIDNSNTGLENAIRLSAYKNAREAGMSPARAASLAKNLTVNFNRRGEWGVPMNAMYLFYNASVQGTARLLQAAATPGRGGRRVRRILGGVAVASFALEMLNAMMSGDDDDGESFYDKISEFEKQRNLIVMIPGDEKGRYIKIPMPYGYNLFSTAGRSLASVMRGRPAMEGAGNVIGNMVDAFNPVGGTNSVLNLIAPTIVDPIVDLYRNRDFAERPIYREQAPYGTEEPNSQMYWGSVNPVWRSVTDALNRATGGDEVLPGAVDINPEVLEYLGGVAGGAAFQFIADRVIGTGAKVISGDWSDIDSNDIPMARKLTGSKPGWYDKAAYYTRTEQIEQIASRPKEYAERGMYDAAEAYALENQKALELIPQVKASKKAMKAVRATKLDIERALRSGDITESQARDARKEVKASEDAIISAFNAAYLKAIDTPKRP